MQWLNYHHLLYFRAAAREGGVSEAARRLGVSAPTVSGQIRQLEEQVGDKLFTRKGRRLALTDVGRTVLGYADDIFALGEELKAAIRHGGDSRPGRLSVGVSMVLPKLVAHRLIRPALDLPQAMEIVCVEDTTERLLAALATHDLDLVLSDAPRGEDVAVRAYDHYLGECSVSFYAAAKLAEGLRRGFPRSLDGAPMLLPRSGTALRTALDRWFVDLGIRPRTVGEFDDSALLKVFGSSGCGVFPVPTVIEREVSRQYRVQRVGRAPELVERYYAISVERQLRHPAVVAISERARGELFGPAPG